MRPASLWDLGRFLIVYQAGPRASTLARKLRAA
jgi:hypothetical protein